MSNENRFRDRRRDRLSVKLLKIMKCFSSAEQLHGNEMVPSSEYHYVTKDNSASVHLSGESERKPDTGNIEEAETSLRESGCLNYEVAF